MQMGHQSTGPRLPASGPSLRSKARRHCQIIQEGFAQTALETSLGFLVRARTNGTRMSQKQFLLQSSHCPSSFILGEVFVINMKELHDERLDIHVLSVCSVVCDVQMIEVIKKNLW
jgi:hypothetical protein